MIKLVMTLFVLLFVVAVGHSAELLYCLQPNMPRQQFIDKVEAEDRSHIIVDISYNGTTQEQWTSDEIRRMKGKNGKSKVLCYFPIGVADCSREYWQTEWKENPPSFILQNNMKNEGNYYVRYWNKQWQQTLQKEMQKIITKGFDGIYLDITAAFDNGASINPETKQTYFNDLTQLILMLAKKGRYQKRGFLVFLQNGEALLQNRQLLTAIDGLVMEDLFSDGIRLNSTRKINQRMMGFWKARVAHKTCFAVEYINAERAKPILLLAQKNGMTLLLTDRKLTELGMAITPQPLLIGASY